MKLIQIVSAKRTKIDVYKIQAKCNSKEKVPRCRSKNVNFEGLCTKTIKLIIIFKF